MSLRGKTGDDYSGNLERSDLAGIVGRLEAEGALGRRAFAQSFRDDLMSISQNECGTSKNVR